MHRAALLLAALTTATSAYAEDEEEYYLLGDYGVRVDLPDDWRSVEWSDLNFEAEKTDRSLKLFAWGELMQHTPTAGNVDAWVDAYEARVESIGGSDAKVVSKKVTTLAGRPTARYELDFSFGESLRGAMSGATFAVEGRMFHLAVITAAKRGPLAAQAIDMLLERAEVRKPAATFEDGAEVSGAGMTVSLPEGWRAPVGGESTAVLAQAKKMGIEDLTGCWTALKAAPGQDPDVMFTCENKILLGVVDEASAIGVAEAVKEKLLGALPTDAPRAVTGADGRTGFVYAAQGKGSTLRLGVMPDGQGAAITRIFGAPDQAAAFDAAIDHVMTTGTYTGDHPVGPADQASYYLTYRPTSPVVLVPVLVLIGLIGGGIFMATRGKKNPYVDLT